MQVKRLHAMTQCANLLNDLDERVYAFLFHLVLMRVMFCGCSRIDGKAVLPPRPLCVFSVLGPTTCEYLPDLRVESHLPELHSRILDLWLRPTRTETKRQTGVLCFRDETQSANLEDRQQGL